MKLASVAEMKARFSEFLKTSVGEPVVVTRNVKPVAVLVGVQDEEEIERILMAYSPTLRAILDRSYQQIIEGDGLPHDQFWSEIERSSPPEHNE